MDWIVHQLRVHPELAIFLTLFVGFWIGKIKIGKFSLGVVTSVLLVGVLVGQLDITVDVVADMTVINPFDFFLEPYAERFPFEYPDALRADLEPYLRRVDEGGTGPGPLITARFPVRPARRLRG